MPITSGELVVGIDATHIASDATLAKTYFIETTLTNAQVKALPTTAIQLIAAPGANKFLDIVSIVAATNITSAWTNINVAFAEMEFGIGVAGNWDVAKIFNDSGSSETMVSDFLTASSLLSSPQQGKPKETESWGMAAQSQTRSLVVNQALSLFMDNNGSGNFTGGNAANNMIVTVTYRIVNI